MTADLDPSTQQILAGYRDTALDDAARAADLLDLAASLAGDAAATEAQLDGALRRLALAFANSAKSIDHYFAQKEWARKIAAYQGGPFPSPPDGAA